MGDNINSNRVVDYVKSYLYEGKGSLGSYIESHSDVLKVKASVFHSEPEVVKAMLVEISKCSSTVLKKMKNGKHLIQISGRYKAFITDSKECPVDCFVRLKQHKAISNDPCENILLLTKIFAFFEFLDKDKFQTQISSLIQSQEAALAELLNRNKDKWTKKSEAMTAKIQKFKLKNIKYY